MSNKIKNPNEKSNGFLWALLAVLVIAAVVIGYIAISGKNAKTDKIVEGFQTQDIHATATFANNAVELKGDKATADTPSVELYEDYSCPHCAELAEATDNDMLKAIDDGKLVVNVRTLSFLDGENKDGHSHRAGGAALIVAQNENAKTYWNFRKLLLEKQKDIYAKWSMEDLSKAAKQVGASDDTVAKIAAATDHQAFTEVSTANEKKLKDETGKVSSPRIIKDGKDIDDLKNWVAVASQK
ncbi:DsbA family protein [Corynebacterium epidermidicanis]|uniref:Protein-disulfide isomerase n=1 Tax=Corynebacterium epidermidicanis TaxID=1050174 RepID=A0A0G3GYF0_9CORY|nr:thioredoxin domain-containing protein [Corynebacterium epidermidicanis]AKK03882.1 protein-disulfide isomerase [Corynebacterium epidermidicanis]